MRAPQLWRELEPHFRGDGHLLMFAHGFNIHYRAIVPPSGLDVARVAPNGPGQRVREAYEHGHGVPALLAVHESASAEARVLAMSSAGALGATRAGLIETTFAEETETDLFGAQVRARLPFLDAQVAATD